MTGRSAHNVRHGHTLTETGAGWVVAVVTPGATECDKTDGGGFFRVSWPCIVENQSFLSTFESIKNGPAPAFLFELVAMYTAKHRMRGRGRGQSVVERLFSSLAMSQPKTEPSVNAGLGLGPYFLCCLVIFQPLAWHPEYQVPAAFFITTCTAILILLIAKRTDLMPGTTYLRGRYKVALGALLFGLNPIGNPFVACAGAVAVFIFCIRFFKKEGVFQRNVASLVLAVLFAFGTLSFNEYVYWIPRPVRHIVWGVLDVLHDHDAECEKFELTKKDFGTFSMDLVGEAKDKNSLGRYSDVELEKGLGERFSFYTNGMKQVLIVAPSPKLPPLVTEEFVQRQLAGGDYGDTVGDPRIDVRRGVGWVSIDLELTLITEDEIRPLKNLYMSWGIMECGDRRALLLTKAWIAEAVSRRHLREVSKSSLRSFDCRIKDDELLHEPTCDIKGNISSKGVRIYHPSSCAHWSKTKIDFSKGEQYFCSDGVAVSAGWRRCR